jgi:hypothetical protein
MSGGVDSDAIVIDLAWPPGLRESHMYHLETKLIRGREVLPGESPLRRGDLTSRNLLSKTCENCTTGER